MTEVVSVRFRSGCKNYYFNPGELQVKMGDQVVVETAQGPEFATCTQGNHDVPDSAVVEPLSPVLRMATENDIRTVEYNRRRESEAFDICEKKIADHGLEMKLVNVLASFDGSKIVFYFTADGRVDFRELVRDLAGVFRARIELRQIGVRDEAKMIGGLGICGRLMCCLKYEQNAYEDAAKRMPKVESFVQTPDGPGNVKSVDLLRETVKVSLDAAPEPLKCYHGCEICVLRNGKGSREGIEVPLERPARYVEELAEEDFFVSPVLSTPFYMDAALEDAPTREKIGGPASEGGKAHRRHRGGRRRTKSAAPKTEQPAEKQPAKGTRKSEPRPERKAGGERKNEPRAEAAAGSKAPAAESGEAKRRRPRHRGGRRRNKSGGEGGAPKSE